MHLNFFRALLAGSALAATGWSAAQAEPALIDAIAAGRPVIDLRARYENVDDASKTPTVGAAGTFRARLGYETRCLEWSFYPGRFRPRSG